MGSLSLRPGDSLTVPRTALSVGFIRFVSSTNATQATGFRLFPRWDSPPTEHASLSLVALCSKKWSGSPVRFRTSDRLVNSPQGKCFVFSSQMFRQPSLRDAESSVPEGKTEVQAKGIS